MRTTVIDLILHMLRMMRLGHNLKDLQTDLLGNYNNSEVSAAYSWVLQKMQDGTITTKGFPANRSMRVLHIAERMVISPEAYGYLLELYNMGIISPLQMENIIEQTMINNFERITLERMKEIVGRQVFAPETKRSSGKTYLSGNESIN